ncbi:Transmembrane protein 17B [Trichinella pseudospiralis]|uniref:Transmembrane protein 17B n=2 Tax=Trichinella pseudospiralis TaxID=6337 RepID=A0A0V1FMZ2_TRIPS|nr:Transmembrane protein 17B [Trichinella pseudospiralis]KRY74730.1 Transmembrane protein 17B [Trichinella pseudospiralis]KRY87253.1 Transmembrane protein 17B [Trichinella pseudospiralis]KRZ26178.1 Transmembrane protein 17B [Trichinella pseudospiralis]
MSTPLKREIISSLPLQMTVYFNAYFAPCWVTAHLYTLFQKYSTLDGTQKSILVIAHIVMIVVEIVRLYLGFVGNLSENGSFSVPKLAGFWITTLMLQFPMMIYQSISSDWSALPLERAVDGLQTIFLIFELIIGFLAVKRIAKFQYSKFRQQMAIKNFEKNNKIE